MDFKSLQNRANIFSSVKVLLAVVVLWAYNNKMLSPSIEAVSSMSRSFVVAVSYTQLTLPTINSV